MTSIRHTMVDGDPGERSTSERILDAARACVLDVGWQRTTLTDVAQRAGVSRMTVYRTYTDMPSIFADLLTREWVHVVDAVLLSADTRLPWPERIAEGVVRAVGTLREEPLVRRMLDLDPEMLLPYLLGRRGRSQDAVIDALIVAITSAQADCAVRAGDPVALARSIVLAAHGFTLSAHTMADDDVTDAAIDHELGELVRRYLA